MRQSKSLTGNFDWWLFGAYILLLLMGVATVYSVAYDENNPSLFAFSEKYGKQIMWLGISLFLGLLVFLIDSDIYRKFAFPIYGATIVLLIIVLFMPPKNGARAWLGIGSLGIQPGEFAKIGTAILLSRFMSSINVKQQNSRTVLTSLAIIGVPMILILQQPDAGTFLVFGAFLFVMYREGITFDPIVLNIVNLIPGVRFKKTWVGTHFIPILFVLLFLVVSTLILSYEPIVFASGNQYSGYWKVFLSILLIHLVGYLIMRSVFPKRERKRAGVIVIISLALMTFISAGVNTAFSKLAPHQKIRIELALELREDPNGDDYNRNRAMAAVGSGGLWGKGYMDASLSSMEANHVPESETDFIFCPFAEEWGFVGSVFLVGIYLFIMLRVIFIAERQRSVFNRIYAYSVAMIIFFHFAVSIGMNIGLVPIIGIPLPFFSYGGSSMMSFSMMLLILLKLDSQRKDVLR